MHTHTHTWRKHPRIDNYSTSKVHKRTKWIIYKLNELRASFGLRSVFIILVVCIFVIGWLIAVWILFAGRVISKVTKVQQRNLSPKHKQQTRRNVGSRRSAERNRGGIGYVRCVCATRRYGPDYGADRFAGRWVSLFLFSCDGHVCIFFLVTTNCIMIWRSFLFKCSITFSLIYFKRFF